MGIDEKRIVEKEHNEDLKRQEFNLQFHWYFFAFFIIFLGSFFIPSIILILYLRYFFVPYFLDTKSFFTLFTDIKSLLALILMPLVIIFCYLTGRIPGIFSTGLRFARQ